MKHVDEFRDGARVRALAAALAAETHRPWTLMEVCGGQTHAILRHGLDRLLPPGLELVHGPGCPVCVTAPEAIDAAIALATDTSAILCTFGDMLRVPGSGESLALAKARGADVRWVYSPLDAVALAEATQGRQVVFFAVGFETTAPASAMAVRRAAAAGLRNFSLLSAHVRVPPAIEAILAAPDNRIQGFLAAGHVCTVMGTSEYPPLAARFGVPIVATGFEPVDILQGVLMAVRQLEAGRAEVALQYNRAVRPEGNVAARALLAETFRIVPRRWRGMGTIDGGGLDLAPAFARFDATLRFGLAAADPRGADAAESGECQAGAVLRGVLRPDACPAFGTRCTPEHPLGAPMVSSEGACAAYWRYRGADTGARP